MSRIPEDTIRDIRSRADIVALVGRYVDLKQVGRNYKGLCPFHGEKTPSFHVNSEKQIFHCFGCQEGGDVIAFLMRHDSLTFPEAARMLAAENGIEIAESDSGERGISEQLYAANEVAQSVYLRAFAGAEGADARGYLEQRGLDAESIERFGIGFAPDSWDAVAGALAKHKIPAEIGEKAGLLAKKRGYYDRLRGRVSFPIRDVRNRIVGFGGRALGKDQEPKYLNTPESPIFHKRRTLYGYPFALEGIRRAERAVLCEGYFDSIALHRAGMSEGLATCGTALTPEHGTELRRRTREVVLLFDGDSAGQKAVERSLEQLLPEGLRVKAASLPQGQDPDSFLLERGVEALRELVDSAPDALEGTMRRAVREGCSTPAEKADIVARMAPLVAKIPDPVERAEYGRRLSLTTDTDSRAVEAVLRSSSRSAAASARPPEEAVRVAPRREERSERDERSDRHVRELAILFYRHPDLSNRYAREKIDQALPASEWSRLVQALLDAALAGELDETGAVDLFRLEGKLEAEDHPRLRELAVDERHFEREAGPTQVLDGLIWRFEKRRLDERQKELTRKMNEPGADLTVLFREKQRLQEEARELERASAGTSS